MYNTQISDTWSLGMLVVCAFTGIFPWSSAQMSDNNYEAYTRLRENYLTYTLPFTPTGISFITRVLEPDPERRVSLEEFRMGLENMPGFMLTEEEVMGASGYARDVYARRAEEVGVPSAQPKHFPQSSSTPSSSTPPPFPTPSLEDSRTSPSLVDPIDDIELKPSKVVNQSASRSKGLGRRFLKRISLITRKVKAW